MSGSSETGRTFHSYCNIFYSIPVVSSCTLVEFGRVPIYDPLLALCLYAGGLNQDFLILVQRACVTQPVRLSDHRKLFL